MHYITINGVPLCDFRITFFDSDGEQIQCSQPTMEAALKAIEEIKRQLEIKIVNQHPWIERNNEGVAQG